MSTQKTIFITVSEATAAKNLLRGSFWQNFNAGSNFKIVLITTPAKYEQYKKEFGNGSVSVEFLVYTPPNFSERFFAFIARNALKTGTTTMNQMRQYKDGGSIFALGIKRLVWFLGGRSKLLQTALRKCELLRSPSLAVKKLFDQYKPDLVFSTIAIHAEIDIPILREAKRRHIFTIGMLRGWDNFTTHGFLRVVPDKLLLQNQYLKEMGIKYQHLPPSIMEVVGFPQNDWYFKKELVEPRDVFLNKLGIDPKKRMILFGAMGDFLFPKEGEIAKVFEELVELGKIPNDLVMVFRAHPAFLSPLEKMKKMKHVIPDRDAKYASSEVDSWEMGGKEMAHLINSIVHSEIVITSGSTMALDAVALGKPAVSVAFENTPIDYWLSACRFRRHYTHYEAMMATGGVREADSKEALASAINDYLKNSRQDEEDRARLRKKFLEPLDGHSGERIAREIYSHP